MPVTDAKVDCFNQVCLEFLISLNEIIIWELDLVFTQIIFIWY